MNEPARIAATDIFVPNWLHNVWHELVSEKYTGKVVLHCAEGRVKKIEKSVTRAPEDYRR